MLHEDKKTLRNIILRHFLEADNMKGLLSSEEASLWAPGHVRKVVYALENSGMLFGSGETNSRLYQTTKDGRKLIGG